MEEVATEQSFDPRGILQFLRRRFAGIGIVAVILLGVSCVTAIVWPPVYRSTATILVEEQEIPQDLVRTTVTSYADQRIQVIGQQVMTRANLLQIVEKYDLYRQRRKTETNEEILERLRKDVKVDVLSADVAGGRRVTIAFTLAYDGETAERAQKVANELVTLYLNENLKIRQQKAADTTSFLSDEAKRLEQHIGDVEAKLAEFKRRNIGRLPELAQFNLQLRDKTDTEVADIDRQVHLLEERRFYLENQLAQTKPSTPIISSTGERILSPEDRLKTLKALVASMSGSYSEDHPDMVRFRREMAALEREVGDPSAASERAKQIEKLESESVSLRERYSEDHPDVVRLRKSIAALKEGGNYDPVTSTSRPPKADNPGYLSLETQLKVLAAEMEGLRKKRTELSAKLATYEARLVQTPQVEQEYLDLSRDRENSVSRYREMKAKLMEAEIGQELEKDRKGERFSLIDPPQFPEKPRSPNRPAILLIGLVAALGGGLGYGGVLEAADQSIKSPKQLGRTFGAPILSVIPRIETARERARRRRKRMVLWALVAAGVVIAGVLIHFFYMPLEVLWYLIPRRIGIAL
jgi:polysaccharide biosynthesis transport protein